MDNYQKKNRSFFPNTILPEQAKETGMAMVLVCLLIAYFGTSRIFSGIATLLLIITMTWPMAYKHVAKLWIGISYLLGTVMSKVLLSVIFLVLVIPVGFIRKLMKRDSMQIKKWKTGDESVFKIRDHRYISDDLVNPY